MQQNKTSDLSESMTEAIDTFVLEFLDFFMSYMREARGTKLLRSPDERVTAELLAVGSKCKPLQELWATWNKEQKENLIASTRQYGRAMKAKKNETCPDCELAEKLVPGIMKEIKDAR